jgi:hypothetical protein
MNVGEVRRSLENGRRVSSWVPFMDAWLVYLLPVAMVLVALSAHYMIG